MSFFFSQRIIIVSVLTAATLIIWAPLLTASSQYNKLEVAFLNVGQGDAVLITTPSGRQMLIDGGAGTTVLRELGAVMPLFDRSIDIVVATHPDADHVGGLVPVLERYDVDALMRPRVAHDTHVARALQQEIADRNIRDVYARRGAQIDLGDGVVFTVLFPDRAVDRLSPNDASIIAQLSYGSHAFIFSGDAPKAIEEYVVTLDAERLKSEVLKVGHHGSNTSSSDRFVGFVDPQYAVISRGCDNRHGHPDTRVIETLERFVEHTLDTCTDGRVVFTSDGLVLTRE